MMNFFKMMLASMLGAFLALGLLFFAFVMIVIAAVSSAATEKKTVIKENTILHIRLDEPVVERYNDKSFNFKPGSFDRVSKLSLNEWMKDVDDAKRNDKIKGIFLDVHSFSAAPSSLLDMRNALLDFRESGKWIVAFSEEYSQEGYYLASAADEVYMYPTGMISWRGMNAEVMFFKKLFDKLEIEAQVVRGPNNKFKSAVEPFIYDHMSDENREQVKTFVDDIWKTYIDGIAETRAIDTEVLQTAADSLSLFDAQIAMKLHVIDGLKYRDEVIDRMKEKLGKTDNDVAAINDDEEKDKLSLINIRDYHTERKKIQIDSEQEKIAVVFAVGGIESGEGDDETIGSDRIAAALKKARKDKKVKAIVLRVNSPGGSALASDVIWRETQLIKQSGKPFVVSMGDYAASGGYYISCGADKIFANRNTITGSIGVFGIIPNYQKFLDNKLGVTFDRFETNPHADIFSVVKPLDKKEMSAMQNMVSRIYDDFTQKVAQGRNKTQTEIDDIGQGRVWSGEDAKNIGLVDELGGLKEAIAEAAEMADIHDYKISELPAMIDPFQKLMQDIIGKSESAWAKEWLGENYATYKKLIQLTKMREPQARLPFFIEFQ